MSELEELEQRFRTVEAELAEHVKPMPPAMAIVSGEAEIPDADRARWTQLQAELTELAVQIHQVRRDGAAPADA